MPQKSSIAKLPKKARLALHKMIEGGASLDEMVAGIEKAYGETISRSAAGRYSKSFRRTVQKMKEAKEMAASLATQLGEVPDNKQGRLLIEMLHTFIFRFMSNLSETDAETAMKSKDFLSLARAIKELAAASKIDTDQEAKIRKEIAVAVSRAAEKAANEVGKIATEGGLSAARVREIRDKLLGVRRAAST